jgi:hypothetical protein
MGRSKTEKSWVPAHDDNGTLEQLFCRAALKGYQFQAFQSNLLPSSCLGVESKTLRCNSSSVTVVAILFQGKATGERAALWLRARLQGHLFQLGCFLHRHAGKVLFVAILVLATFCVGLKSAQVHTRVDQLWVEGKTVQWMLEMSNACNILVGKPFKCAGIYGSTD